MKSFKIGIFDSGLGGLVIAKSIIKRLPKYDYYYFGDTKNLPYGSKSQTEIYRLTTNALKFLFAQNCKLVIIACNTASAKALRKIQQEFLPKYFPDRKVLGVIVPTIEDVVSNKKIKTVGVIATKSTTASHSYKKEISKINKKIEVIERATPKLVPMIENDTLELIDAEIQRNLRPLLNKNIDALVLGCTHYPILKQKIQKFVGKNVKVFSQEEIVPKKLASYLKKHPEIEKVLRIDHQRKFSVSRISSGFIKVAQRLFENKIELSKI